MKPLVLIILDGWGLWSEKKDNGIAQAKTPYFDRLWNQYPHTAIEASGPAVGLPAGVIGNSEVGHMNIGAGRIAYTGLAQIYHAIEDGSFYKNPALLGAIKACKENRSALHLMGLLSDGAVHSHQDHLVALLEMAKREQVISVFVHCFMDGRDTPPTNGIKYVRQLEEVMTQKGAGKIATISGRYYAMDRDKRWDRIQKAYGVLIGADTSGESSAEQIINKSYQKGVTDEFIVPRSVMGPMGPIGPIKDKDSVIFFNFRADRAREMTRALTEADFGEFQRKKFVKLSRYACMAPYDETFPLPSAFKPTYPQKTFGEIVSQHGLKQLRLAETEKYAHVTYFFSGGREKPFAGEERILIPSPREVPTYDLKPEMGAYGITEEVLKRLDARRDDVIIMNYANPDMVGHTAKPDPIHRAVEVVDECLKKVVERIQAKGGEAVITSDHGNAEQMVDEKGAPHTAHTLNPVPFVVVSERLKGKPLKNTGRLCDIAPTLLAMLGIPQPKEMTGESLILK